MAELGIAPGPLVGTLIDAVDEAAAAGEVSTRAEAIELARKIATSPPAPSPSTERGIADQNDDDERLRQWRTGALLWDRLKPRAREMRHAPTPAEDKLWQSLRRRQLDGLAFRRQHAIDRFLVDFYCPARRLAIEVDGGVHERSIEEDRLRDEMLQRHGVRVLRIKNEMVMRNLPSVLTTIREAASAPSPSPWTERGTEGERS
jgi:very-short-patch-repair endonuclease